MRLWVKRGFNGTPASIQLDNDDLIDDVKDAVFRKYPMALARYFDSPDVSICISRQSKSTSSEQRVLAVDERVADLVRTNYPNGQRIEDALIIQVPATQMKVSPYANPGRPHGSPLSGTIGLLTTDMRDFEYFPPTPPLPGDQQPTSSQHHANTRNFAPSNYSSGSHSSGGYVQGTPVTVLEGSVRPAPNLSMGSVRHRDRSQRPVMINRATTHSSSSQSMGSYGKSSDGAVTFHPKPNRTTRTSSNPPQQSQRSPRSGRVNEEVNYVGGEYNADQTDLSLLPSVEIDGAVVGHRHSISGNMMPMVEVVDTNAVPQSPVNSRGRRDTASLSPHPPRPGLGARTLTQSKLSMVSPVGSAHSSTHSVVKLETPESIKKKKTSTFGVGGLLEGVVPPIDVLIVEDNMINQRILETFMKKRKIRCLTAKNGKEAVEKWRKGGIHLVLMDIQMPIMSGIEATKEIRRLERLNSIGVFSKKEKLLQPEEEDVLTDVHFRSPVIIVALTASSLQSDRHEALAAGCNDFLTKPVSLVWLEKKVLEWGCMQALIDFEGWKKFRGLKEIAA